MRNLVYVVTSAGNDVYSALTRVSLASVRITNPGINICLCCDTESYCAMNRIKDLLLQEVDKIEILKAPDGQPEFRNRFIKTNLRNLIDGPFLFLDSDTLVRQDVSSLFSINADIAGARNHSKNSLHDQIWEEDNKVLELMNWKVREDVYINGGVVFFDDTANARATAKQWHQNWLYAYTKAEYSRDQPALNNALFVIKPKLEVFDDKFNAQFTTNLAVSLNAAIWHYYYSGSKVPMTAFELMIKNFDHHKPVNTKAVKRMINCFHPWRRDYLLDDFIARRIFSKGLLEPWVKKYLKGKKREAIFFVTKAKIKELLSYGFYPHK